ncbi:Hpt domain-containing protein [Candidatus Roizmanbacteria bacterium]|nr:Hpt domain-containing protein [Candidatus Roizmanbacteria bacterium]
MATIDMTPYKELFLKAAREYLENMKKNIMVLNTVPTQKEAVYETYRGAHSIRGQALLMGYPKLVEICSILESFFREVRESKKRYDPSMFSDLISAITKIGQSLKSIEDNNLEADLSEETDKLKSSLTVSDSKL